MESTRRGRQPVQPHEHAAARDERNEMMMIASSPTKDDKEEVTTGSIHIRSEIVRMLSELLIKKPAA